MCGKMHITVFSEVMLALRDWRCLPFPSMPGHRHVANHTIYLDLSDNCSFILIFCMHILSFQVFPLFFLLDFCVLVNC